MAFEYYSVLVEKIDMDIINDSHKTYKSSSIDNVYAAGYIRLDLYSFNDSQINVVKLFAKNIIFKLPSIFHGDLKKQCLDKC